jgi:hypothetical protein
LLVDLESLRRQTTMATIRSVGQMRTIDGNGTAPKPENIDAFVNASGTVSHVLEGSVCKAGEQIRVTVQLIEAATDAHVWAENDDRKLDDVFAIQSEIALAIADQLQLSLSSELQADLTERQTQNQAAYARYLRALEAQRERHYARSARQRWAALTGNQAQAREQLARALAAPPNSELAGFYSQLSTVERRLGNAEAVVVGEKAFELNVLPGHIT